MAWNEPGNGQRDPWSKGRRPRPPGGKHGLDALLKDLRRHLGRFGGGRGGLLTLVAALVVVWLLLGSYTVVGASQSGVVLRFGRYARTLGPGFHFKLPQPFESVSKVATASMRSMSDQMRTLTRDENIVSVNFNVQYRVADARKFLFSARDPEDSLREAAESVVRAAVGAHTMDELLASGDSAAAGGAAPAAAGSAAVPAAPSSPGPADLRGTLQRQVRDLLQRALDGYDCGLQVTDVGFQDIAPPQEVKDAFDDVNAAREDKQEAESKARAYASQVIPQARGDAARIAAEAAGDKAVRIARAQGDAEQFDLLLKQYKAAPDIMRRRLWLETMEQVLANEPKVIDGSDGHNVINLPSATSAAMPAAAPVDGDAAGKEKQP